MCDREMTDIDKSRKPVNQPQERGTHRRQHDRRPRDDSHGRRGPSTAGDPVAEHPAGENTQRTPGILPPSEQGSGTDESPLGRGQEAGREEVA